MLNVFLGFACNLKCSYCLQAKIEDRNGSPPLRTSIFLDRVIPIIKAKNIRRIAYWGGEPVLYWRHIQAIHDGLLSAGIVFDIVKITSNGTLLEEEHADDLNRWRAFLNVSRHRGFGVPRWKTLKRVKTFAYSHVVTAREHLLHDFLDEVRTLEGELGRPFFPWVNWVHATKGCPPSEYLTMDMAREHAEHLKALAHELVATQDRHIGNMFIGHVRKWQSQMERQSFVPMCFGDHQIDVDLEGNRYGCHHNVSKETLIGPWGGEVTHQAGHDLVHRFVSTQECQACPIRFWCRGNCHMSQTHEVDCYLAKRKSEVFKMLDEHWTSMDEWDQSYLMH